MKEIKITCDSCGADLTGGTPMPGFRLRLTEESIPTGGGMVFGINVVRELEHDMYFCWKVCLRNWMNEPKAGMT